MNSVSTKFADADHTVHAKAERRELFVIQSMENAAAQKVCRRVLIPLEETSVIQRTMFANAQHPLQLAADIITALLDLALVNLLKEIPWHNLYDHFVHINNQFLGRWKRRQRKQE